MSLRCLLSFGTFFSRSPITTNHRGLEKPRLREYNRIRQPKQDPGGEEPKRTCDHERNRQRMEGLKGKDNISLVERVAWLIFCLICLHLAFLWPYYIIFPGQRANLFSGTLCAIALCAALTVALKRSVRTSSAEVLISIGLLGLAAMSAWANSGSEDAMWRVFILMASGLGGFWCARILLNSPFRQRVFAWLCLGCLVGIGALSLWHYPETGTVDYFLYSRSHPLIQMLILFSAGPIALLSRGKPVQSLLGVVVLVGMYVCLYLIGVDDTRSAVLIPLAVLALLAVLASFGSRLVVAAFVLLLVLSAVTAHYASNLSHRELGQYQEYRIESYPFSWYIAEKYPLAGIGLRTPRDSFVPEYQKVQADYPENVFVREVSFLVTSENIFLTFMVGLGLPFLVLYGFALIALLVRLIRMVFRPPADDAVFHPLALLLPLAASLLHSFTTDVLLYPQICWFFHVILGLVPCRPQYSSEKSMSWRGTLARTAAAAAVVAFGVFVGTQQAFHTQGSLRNGRTVSAPSNSDSAHASGETRSKVRIGQQVSATSQPSSRSRSTDNHPVAEGGKGQAASRPFEKNSGTLVVHIENYVGTHINWQLMLIVDNSDTLYAEAPPWQPTRARAASDFLSGLPRVLPATAKVAVRDFSSETFGRKGDWQVPLRVSRLLCSWDEAPFSQLGRVALQMDSAKQNNLCNAAANSMQTDFDPSEDFSGRVVLVTDGSARCSWDRIVQLAQATPLKAGITVDVVALGMTDAHQQPFLNLANETRGEFVRLERPADVKPALERYGAALRRVRPATVELRGFTGHFRVLPGKEITLPAGPYTLVLPQMDGLDPSKKKVPQRIRVKAGEATSVTLSLTDGQPTIH